MSIQSQLRLDLSSREIRTIKEKSFSIKVERQLNHLTDAELPDTATKAPFQRLEDAAKAEIVRTSLRIIPISLI